MKKLILLGGLLVAAGGVIAMIAKVGPADEKAELFLSGQVELPAEFLDNAKGIDVLYIIVYDENSAMPMPYGAVREWVGDELASGKLSFDFQITPDSLNIMNESLPHPQKMRVKARFDRDGNAGPDQRGDLTGEVQSIAFGSRGVSIPITRLID